MADLRSDLYTGRGNLSADQLARIDAADMGTLRRSYTGGRITNDINPMLADIASLEADGTPEARTKAAGLRDQVSALEQRRAAYAPEVGKVENINGIGSGLTWVGEQVGQGVASMQDMMLTGAGLTAAGRAVGAIPHPIARAAGMALQGGGVLAPYLMNQRQLAGEAYGDMTEDAALMARTTPQQRYEMARNYGALAAIPDTALPALVGRQLAGAGLRKGLSKIGPAAMTGLELLGEGTTELGQEVGKQYALGQLNPERDTSQDASANLNSFLGGAVGAGPSAAAGAYADAGYRRVGDTAEKIGTKAGQVVDLAGQKLGPMAEEVAKKGRGWIGAGKEKVDASLDSFKGEDGRVDLSKVVAASKETAGEVRDNAARAVFGITPQERDVLEQNVPEDILNDQDPAKMSAWLTQNDQARAGMVTDRLSSIDDPQAADIVSRIAAATQAQDIGAQQLATDEGAKYLLDRAEETKLAGRAERFAQTAGSAAATAGKGVLEFGKAVVRGAKEGLSKKNAQVEPYDAWRARRVAGESSAERIQREDSAAQAGKTKPAPIDAAGVERSRRRAELFGEILAAQAKDKGVLRAHGTRAQEAAPMLMREMGYQLADLAESWGLNEGGTKPSRAAAGRQASGLTYALDRVANSLRVAFGKDAEATVNDLESLMQEPGAKPFFDHMRESIAAGRTPAGRVKLEQARKDVANQMMSLLPVEQAKAIIANGQQMDLLEHIEDFADGYITPSKLTADEQTLLNSMPTREERNRYIDQRSPRAVLEAAVGKENLTKMVDLVNGVTTSKDRGNEALLEARDDDVTDYELRQAEKNSVKGAGAKIYGVSKSPVLRDNPFAPNERMSKEQFKQWMDDEVQRKNEGLPPQIEPEFKRPTLFKTGDPQLDARVAHMGEKLDSTYHIAPRSAWEVMDDTNMPLARRLATYRDYMREDGQDTRTVQKAVLDAMDGHDFGEWANPAGGTSAEQQRGSGIKTTTPATQAKSKARLTDGQRNVLFNEMQAYFSERHLAVAEQIADRAPGQISRTELLSMVRAGKRAFDLHRMKDNPDEHLDQSNLLMFKSEMANQKTDAPGVIYIPVHQLMKWVQAQRERSETVEVKKDDEKDKTYSNRNKNEAYLADVMEGISIILNSGMVEDQLPARVEGLREDGTAKYTRFAGQNIPKNLRLATMTYGQMMYGREKAAARRAEEGKTELSPHHNEYGSAKNEADDLRDPNSAFVAEQSPDNEGVDPYELWGDLKQVKRVAERTVDTGIDRGRRLRIAVAESSNKKAKQYVTTDPDATPLDFFSDIEKPAVPDEFDDQQFRTKNGGESAYSPLPAESKMNAWKEADKNADALLNRFRTGDVAGGLAEIEQRLRAAKTPSYSPDKYAAVGGLHYAVPLAQVLNPDVISTMDIVDADAQRIVAARAELAGLVRDAKGFSDAQRLRLTRAMAPAESAARITIANYRKALEKAINAAPTEEQMTEAPKAAASKTEAPKAAASKDALATAITLRQNYLDNPPADYSADTVRGIIKWAERQAERVAAAAKELDGSEDFKRVDEVNDRAIDLRVLIKSAKESLAQDEAARAADPTLFGTDAAPEVAAQSPKSSSAPGGGRKLNAQTSEDNNDRQARLITRLAGERADQFRDAQPDRLFRREVGPSEFGPVRGVEHYFLTDADRTHAWVVPRGFVSALQQKLSSYPADRHADVLTFFSIQHAFYNRADGSFESFGPHPQAPGGTLLARLGALGDTGKQFTGGIPMTRVEGVPSRQLADFLADALAYTKKVLGTADLPVKWKRESGANPGKTGEGIFNAQDRAGSTRVASDADIAEAKAFFHKVLGPQVKVLFKEITGYSGEWLDAENTAVISTMAAAGTMQTAYHEALHAFFSKYVKGDPKVLPIMKALAENERVLERVKALLHEYPAALAQLADGEERLAYIYQFWAAGLLKLGPGPGRTWLQKLGKFFRGVLGLVSDSERAVDLLEAFHAGKMAEPSAAGRVIAKLTAQPVTVKVRRKLDGLSQIVAAATLPAESILLNSPSAAVRDLGRKFFSNPGDEEAGKYPEAYLNARKRESIKYHGVFARAVAGLDSSDLKEVAKYLQQGTDPANIPYKPHADAVKGVREALDRFYTYMKDEKGLSVGYIERYYPVIWSTDILHDKKDEFIKMLTDNYGDILAKGVASTKGNLDEAGVAERIWAALIRNGGGDNKIAPARSDGVLVPYFESGEHRVLNWIKPEHREPFLQKDLIGQVSKYFHEGARKAEYQSRFGEHGEKLSEILDPRKEAFDELRWADANKDGPPPGLLDVEYVTKPGQKTLIVATFAGTAETELMAEADKMVARGELKNAAAAKKWVARQMRDVRQAVGAMEGTLGKDIPEGWRKFNSWMTVYQNVRLLPLALFSSIVDPLGMVARGAELKDAYAAFLAGMKEVVRAWGNEFRDEPKASGLDPKWTRLAEAVGATEAELFAHHVSEEFSSDYMVHGAKTINDKMFILNGMEAWNRAMRIAGTKAAVEFIVKHKSLPDKVHSARWLQELGLKPEDIVLNADGELVTDRHELARLKNIPLEQATKEMQRTHWAINRWVEGAILTPNAAQRPSWSSDPRWGVLFHLKQFTYSFHYTLLKRAVKELEYGNLAPIGAFAWYIPVMIASDITRGLIQGGGDLPAYMKGWDAGDWMVHGAQRAGFLGVGQIGVDAGADVASLGGPAVEQMIDAMRDPLEHSTIKALPLQPIFRNAALS